MKIAVAILAIFMFLGCGIVEFMFPNEYPQRYIQRKVDVSELVGRWEIEPVSETGIIDYIKENDLSSGQINSPWRSITLKKDGSCSVDLEISWDPNNEVLTAPGSLSTCTWKIDRILGYTEDGSFQDVPGLVVSFKHFNELDNFWHLYFSENYIVEENGELVLWSFVTGYLYQDFVKSGE